ncbi:SMP-30/gluconolactonase/LRE family protein [Larsenimonas suaedae]|uniref:SMP-30/gluconolactonase/LRE family protein n=1 Tax=Larsenimonas suaedae TaxID=1851019 RepID=A0ABU1GTZ9_9GAMM|nr:SMP-30/gluconolactonase/LRE family protein [Larsenimonas suaedae]MCM2971936.1 SMP-30/gluconolactonase/LRE family protein [Larsenimonas suaedae]MDR5895488.1 SMP-30/gluconolactonase/LRE family protein [Larsenimonas suaedae]
MDRRGFLAATAAFTAAASASAPSAFAETKTPLPSRYPDSAWQSIDGRFKDYYLFNAPLQRHWSKGLWLEGPAWNAVGRYAVFSDIPRAKQMRWDEASGNVSVLREKVGHSNGHAFDDRGRLLACEHYPARVVRYEWDGTTTVLAERYQGKPLNGPNDLVTLPGGGVIFTDPGYGAHADYEGRKRPLELPPAVYYIDDAMDEPVMLTEALTKPNGVALLKDRTTLFISDTAPSHSNKPATITRWTIKAGGHALEGGDALAQSNSELYDGLSADQDGNVWAATSGGRKVDGASAFAPDGTLLGRILLPEVCGNLCFGGEDRNQLIMTASRSLYSIYTGARGVA